MKLNEHQFLAEENTHPDEKSAQYAILPLPFEGGVSYGAGAAKAPQAVIEASKYLECYDEVFKIDPLKKGIITLAPVPQHENEVNMQEAIYEATKEIIAAEKIPVIIGGDHSISSAVFRAFAEQYNPLSCLQIDAHTDLRDSYQGSKYSHASVMARIREQTPYTLQLGIRSMSAGEAAKIESQQLAVFTMNRIRSAHFDLDAELEKLPDTIFITFDVDAMDWSVVRSTGTPEPGGFLWDEMIEILTTIFKNKTVVGFDMVELAPNPSDRNSTFAVAKLVFKMIVMHQVFSRDKD